MRGSPSGRIVETPRSGLYLVGRSPSEKRIHIIRDRTPSLLPPSIWYVIPLHGGEGRKDSRQYDKNIRMDPRNRRDRLR